jgi:hypothetical protein
MTTDSGRPLFIGWIDLCGAAFAATLGNWAHQILPSIEVSLGPDLRTDRRWHISLLEAVRGAAAALVCVIGEQASSPWLHLQLGVCFRTLGKERPLVPVLLDVEPESLISTPLALFQAVRPTEKDFTRLAGDLGNVFAPGEEPDSVTPKEFEFDWQKLLYSLDGVPGPSVKDFQIVLVLPSRIMSIPNSAPAGDEEWTSVIRRITATHKLPGISLPSFASSDLECLDLTREEWMRAPRLVSRLRTRNVALVHREVRERYHDEARAIAKAAKLHLTSSERR